MEIKVYSTPTCFWCQKIKEWLKKNKISYQDLNIIESDTYRDEMIEKSSQMAVPVTIIKEGDKEDVVVGFDEPRLSQLLVKEKVKEKVPTKEKKKKK